MADSSLIRTSCPHCEKKIGVRPDQIGRSLRCPACQRLFTLTRPPDEPLGPQEPPERVPKPDASDTNWPQATNANEMARIGPPPQQTWPQAQIVTRFSRPRDLVFQATIEAVRGAQCEVIVVDWTHTHFRFSLPVHPISTHDVYVFLTPDGASEVEITSQEPNVDGQFDSLFQAVIREIEKYLRFTSSVIPGPVPAPASVPYSAPNTFPYPTSNPVPYPVPMPLPPPPPPPPSFDFDAPTQPDYDDDDYYYRPRFRRRRRQEGGSGIAVAGFICGLLGILLCCIPFVNVTLGALGIVFGAIGMANSRGNGMGFAIAGLVLGILACMLAAVQFLQLAARV